MIAIVIQAMHRVGKRALTHPALVSLAVASFLALTLFAVPFPVVVFSTGLLGWVLSGRIPALPAIKGHSAADRPTPLISDDALHHDLASKRRSITLIAVGLALWFAPVLAAELLIDSTDVFVDHGLFFSGAAVVTFGGAYAVLAYVAQQAVHVYGWLAPCEMVRRLALTETTPGPLIMVVQFVAFVGAYRNPGNLDPWVAAVLASILVTWVTFVPCFLFVLLGAPYVERLRNNHHLTAALTGITAAVVGVIANLAVFFALHNLFGETRHHEAGPVRLDLPVLSSWNPTGFALTAVALALIFKRGWTPLGTLGACPLLGIVAFALGGV